MALAGGDYEIRIKGRLSDSPAGRLRGPETTVQPVATVLHGPVPGPGGALPPAGPDPVARPPGAGRDPPATAGLGRELDGDCLLAAALFLFGEVDEGTLVGVGEGGCSCGR